jgi:hypothetical protein
VLIHAHAECIANICFAKHGIRFFVGIHKNTYFTFSQDAWQ